MGGDELPNMGAGKWTRIIMEEQLVLLTVASLFQLPSSYPCNFYAFMCQSFSFYLHLDIGKIYQMNVGLLK